MIKKYLFIFFILLMYIKNENNCLFFILSLICNLETKFGRLKEYKYRKPKVIANQLQMIIAEYELKSICDIFFCKYLLFFYFIGIFTQCFVI